MPETTTAPPQVRPFEREEVERIAQEGVRNLETYTDIQNALASAELTALAAYDAALAESHGDRTAIAEAGAALALVRNAMASLGPPGRSIDPSIISSARIAIAAAASASVNAGAKAGATARVHHDTIIAALDARTQARIRERNRIVDTNNVQDIRRFAESIVPDDEDLPKGEREERVAGLTRQLQAAPGILETRNAIARENPEALAEPERRAEQDLAVLQQMLADDEMSATKRNFIEQMIRERAYYGDDGHALVESLAASRDNPEITSEQHDLRRRVRTRSEDIEAVLPVTTSPVGQAATTAGVPDVADSDQTRDRWAELQRDPERMRRARETARELQQHPERLRDPAYVRQNREAIADAAAYQDHVSDVDAVALIRSTIDALSRSNNLTPQQRRDLQLYYNDDVQGPERQAAIMRLVRSRPEGAQALAQGPAAEAAIREAARNEAWRPTRPYEQDVPRDIRGNDLAVREWLIQQRDQCPRGSELWDGWNRRLNRAWDRHTRVVGSVGHLITFTMQEVEDIYANVLDGKDSLGRNLPANARLTQAEMQTLGLTGTSMWGMHDRVWMLLESRGITEGANGLAGVTYNGQRIDENRDGQLSSAELGRLLKRIAEHEATRGQAVGQTTGQASPAGTPISASEVTSTIQENVQSGALERGNWRGWNYRTRDGRTLNVFDRDGDGRLELDEIRNALSQAGVDFNRFDANRDGQLSGRELTNAMQWAATNYYHATLTPAATPSTTGTVPPRTRGQ